MSNLARLCLDLEKYDEVEELSKRALAISQSLAPSHPGVANSLNNLADVHAIQGRCAQAEPLYRQALTILEEAFGPEHPAVANILRNLADLYFLQQRYAEADSLYRRSIALKEKSLGPTHPDLADALTSYAILLQKTKRKSEATALNARAQEILARNPAARSAYQTVDVRDLDRSGKGWRE